MRDTKRQWSWGVLGVAFWALSSVGADGCGGGAATTEGGSGSPPKESEIFVRMELNGAGDFYDAPFPSEHRRSPSGGIDLSGFPEIPGSLLTVIRKMAEGSDGFGLTSGVFFTTTGPIDTSTLPPDPFASLTSDASVFLVSVDKASQDFGKRYPIHVKYMEDGGRVGAPSLLGLLPYQGVALRATTLYAAVITSGVHDNDGLRLSRSKAMGDLADGAAPDGLSGPALSAYEEAFSRLTDVGVDPSSVVGMAVFRTGDPTAGFSRAAERILDLPEPAPKAPFAANEVFDDFCVFETTIEMPSFQKGVPPFDHNPGDADYVEGEGGWVFDDNGYPVLQTMEEAKLVVTIPRAPMPDNGYPVVVFSRTGGGGDRPLVDRGWQPASGAPPAEPGTGPAREFAQVGFAGSQIDGPHGGLRRKKTTNLFNDEQFMMFNVLNPLALRDNVRQSAVELLLQAHILEHITVDASSCPGATTPDGGPARFDTSQMAAFGHSMGATIFPLALAFEPRLKAAILSGAGSSYIDNVLHKQKPVSVKGFVETFLKYEGLHALDPGLTLLQWAAEPADPPVYAPFVLAEPLPDDNGAPAVHHLLMVEGVVDNYILPPIANATSLSIGLDLGGAALDESPQQFKDSNFDPFSKVAPLTNRQLLDLPAQGNFTRDAGPPSTAILVQHVEDMVEDGHEVVFQTEGPKHQYRCFLASFLQGTPRVPASKAISEPCD